MQDVRGSTPHLGKGSRCALPVASPHAMARPSASSLDHPSETSAVSSRLGEQAFLPLPKTPPRPSLRRWTTTKGVCRPWNPAPYSRVWRRRGKTSALPLDPIEQAGRLRSPSCTAQDQDEAFSIGLIPICHLLHKLELCYFALRNDRPNVSPSHDRVFDVISAFISFNVVDQRLSDGRVNDLLGRSNKGDDTLDYFYTSFN